MQNQYDKRTLVSFINESMMRCDGSHHARRIDAEDLKMILSFSGALPISGN